MKRLTLLGVAVVSFVFYQCSSPLASDTLSNAVEAGLTALYGTLDEQVASTFASANPTFQIQDLLLPTAWAATCSGRASSTTCSSGVRSTTYSSCTLGNLATLTGSVALTYSQSSCAMATVGDTVTRTASLTKTITSINAVTSSASHTDYRGNTISGGGKITTTLTGWDLTVLGFHKTRTHLSRTVQDISVQTTADIPVTGSSLSRSQRTVGNGSTGALEIINNLKSYVATLVPNSLTHSSDCCYPTGGTIAVTYSGSLSGTGMIRFLGCGSGSITQDGTTTALNFNYCE